jgi:phosphate-selective porin OprO/OprP
MTRTGITRVALRPLLLACVILLSLSQSGLAQASPGAAADTLAWNEFDLWFSTFRFGGGLLTDYATFGQNQESKEQVDPSPGFRLRDVRLLFRGRFRGNWGATWQIGVMFDEPTNTLRFRQTGFMLPLPEPWGRVFIGRTKEGVSLNKLMVGYFGWTMERFTFSDAALPILADGIRWYGYWPKAHFIWQLGAYADWYSEIEAFSKDEHTYITRLVWVTNPADTATSLLHVGINGRIGQPDEGELRLRSRPEAFRAPYYIDTGTFPARWTYTAGPEVYYRRGPWLAGTEYYFQKVDSPETGSPIFHGGDVFVTRLIGKATRSYNPMGGYFGAVRPDVSIFEGGLGAWDAVLRLSYSDLDNGTIDGGSFWRITPMFSWYLSSHFRLELAYGYGVLDRFDLEGATQFYQVRWQMNF